MAKLGNVLINVMQDLSRVETKNSAQVKVNNNLCTPNEFEALFDYFTVGTPLEHIDLNVEPLQTQMECGCGYQEPVNGSHQGYANCPNCGRFAEVKDQPYELVDPDPNRTMSRGIRF